MAGLSRLGLRLAPQSLRRVWQLTSNSRTMASAAAIQYEYEDDEDYYHDYEAIRPCPAMEEAAGSTWERGVQWVLIGDPGAKKHVYAEKLAKLLEVPHISMGTLLREELNPRSSLYKQIANAVNEGKLVPEDEIFGLLSKRLEDGYNRGENGFILDCIPRTRLQAEILDELTHVDLVVNFNSPQEQFVKKDFITMGNSSSPIANTGTVLKEKFRVYAEEGKALEDYYRKQKKLIDFHMGTAPGETWQGLLAALHLKHLSAASSSQKLIV